ncbi:MAG: hypothetical protein IPQ18_08355 [Saprospiraceae bacterium]|nr:hypothetical protein [Saprospiraceae bacterium]
MKVLYGPKKGFGVPYQNWLKGAIRQFMIDIFNDPKIVQLGIFDYNELNNRIEEHRTGKRDWGFSLWKMLNFCLWVNMYQIEGFE